MRTNDPTRPQGQARQGKAKKSKPVGGICVSFWAKKKTVSDSEKKNGFRRGTNEFMRVNGQKTGQGDRDKKIETTRQDTMR